MAFIPALQSARGIASLIVVCGHCLNVFQEPAILKRAEWVLNSHAAVVLFFVLSGYVLSLSLDGSAFFSRSTAFFYIKRVFRIYPALFFASAISLLFLSLNSNRHYVDITSVWFDDRFRSSRYNSVEIFLSFAGISAFLLPPVWSVSVELFASALLPLIAIIAKKRNAFLLLIGLSLIYNILELPGGPYGMLSHIMDFLVGVHLRRVITPYLLHFHHPSSLIPAILSVFILATVRVGLPAPTPGELELIHIAESFASAIIIKSIVMDKFGSGLLRSRWLHSIGNISYSIYLLHFPILYGLAHTIILLTPEIPTKHPVLSNWLLLLFTLPLTFMASVFSYTNIERLGVTAGSNLIRRLRSP